MVYLTHFFPGLRIYVGLEPSNFEGFAKFQNSNCFNSPNFHIKKRKLSYMNFGTLQILINVFDDKYIVDSNSNESRYFYSEK